MKCVLLQENLKKCLSLIERVAGKNINLPILENVLLIGEKNSLRCICTDLEIAIETFCPGKIEQSGQVLVPIRTLSGFISYIPTEKIVLEEKGDFLHVSTKTHKASLKTFSPKDFPLIPKLTKEVSIRVEEEVFLKSLHAVLGISSLSDLKPEITGVFILCSKNILQCAATDSFRLAEKKSSCTVKTDKKISFILPLKTVQELVHILPGRKGILNIFIEPNQVLFEEDEYDGKNPKFKLISRLIEGDFPQYEQVIPKTSTTEVRLPTTDLVGAIKAASLFSSKINDVTFLFYPKKNIYSISTKNPELGKQETRLTGKGKGEDVEVVFNWKFVLDGLSRIESAEVLFHCNKDSGPALIRPVGDESFLYVIMPIKNT